MKCRITFQGGFGMHEDARDRFASIIIDVPDNIARMVKEHGASYSHVIATEWLPEDMPFETIADSMSFSQKEPRG